MTAKAKTLKVGTLVEFRFHVAALNGGNGRRARIGRTGSLDEYHVRIEECPADWTPRQTAQQVGRASLWCARDFFVVAEGR
jgi:hypothetical protein